MTLESHVMNGIISKIFRLWDDPNRAHVGVERKLVSCKYLCLRHPETLFEKKKLQRNGETGGLIRIWYRNAGCMCEKMKKYKGLVEARGGFNRFHQ